MANFSDGKNGVFCTCTRERCSDDCRTYRKYKPRNNTNADYIRAMTDEELATYLDNMQGLAYINGFDSEPIRLYPNNYGAWLDWLRQEAEPCTK